ncbi:hypothetical protein G7075_07735 [Phycicoccus sp. HDW14]|uniref:hypothetical protein n=1 Tax=Phycicoccus sp. HDW14 TaxID=2714941 RepID=UPI00140E33B6|nr:hypothetical protein [Phycicoccus sp. HDW14]QIM21049.1 hypothetical protein G7075_07735 [Phycicoccus sp. HDW14]
MADPAPPPVTDLATVFPDLDRIRRRALSGDLAGAVDDIALLGDRRSPDQGVAWDVLARSDGLDDVVAARLAADPHDHTARTLQAHRLLLAAEEAAGEPGSEVTAEAFALVHDRLRQAEQVLLRLCAEDPTDPQPWVLRLWSAGQLALPPGEVRRRWARLHALDPQHAVGRRLLVRALAPAPGGSWDDALTAAREAAGAAPAGGVEGTVLAAAHLARWRFEGSGRDRGYLRRKEVLTELEEVADRFRALPCPSQLAWVQAHSELAVLFGVAGRTDRARSHFRVLGGVVDASAWGAAGHHRDALATLRAEALTEGEGR